MRVTSGLAGPAWEPMLSEGQLFDFAVQVGGEADMASEADKGRYVVVAHTSAMTTLLVLCMEPLSSTTKSVMRYLVTCTY